MAACRRLVVSLAADLPWLVSRPQTNSSSMRNLHSSVLPAAIFIICAGVSSETVDAVESVNDEVKTETKKQDKVDRAAQAKYDAEYLWFENWVGVNQHGAVVATYARVDSFLKDDNGRIQGAVVKCQTTGQLKEVRASVVVNATGPWTDKTMAMSGARKSHLLRPTKGVHVVVEYDKLPIQHAVVCFHPTDERVLFVNDTDRQHIRRFDVQPDGTVKEFISGYSKPTPLGFQGKS